MPAVKAYKENDPSAPPFPEDFELVKKAVLQLTDLAKNNNKYYAIELHQATAQGKPIFRVYTHYGRTDDLVSNPNAGVRECRFFQTLAEAEAAYQSIYREKTSASKGYKEVALANSLIGSHKARGSSVGEIDEATKARAAAKANAAANGASAAPPAPAPSKLAAGVQELVRYLYDEAKSNLTQTVNVQITADGIKTPLGILTLGQIEKGEAILQAIYQTFQSKAANKAEQLKQLTSDFYTAIPHHIGRTRAAIAKHLIDNLAAIEEKQNTLQLMKDMLQVNGESGSVLFRDLVDEQYAALGCELNYIEPGSPQFKELADYVVHSQIKSKSIKVKNIYTVKRPPEWEQFTSHIDNQRLLFHGSRIQNWVGILTRGILLPKIVVSMGVQRTDAGWLGNGIYFGDAACTSSFYTTPGKKKTRFMALARVALGRMKDYTKITYGLTAPPEGYDSCHGVRNQRNIRSDFADDEYVIYDVRQQRLEYLVEFLM
jgi:poly [ADP-ribose] polymerase